MAPICISDTGCGSFVRTQPQNVTLLIIDELGYVPLSQFIAELLVGVFS